MSQSISTDAADNQTTDSAFMNTITVTCEDRWQVYHRLQDLSISCSCGGFRPLQVQIQTPTELLQLRSVVQRVSCDRQVLIAQLNRCWKL